MVLIAKRPRLKDGQSDKVVFILRRHKTFLNYSGDPDDKHFHRPQKFDDFLFSFW